MKTNFTFLVITLLFILALPVFSAKNDIQKRDTVFTINNSTKLVFSTFSPQFKLWYNPVIEKSGKRTKILEYSYENGSELNISVSPNKRYVLFDEINKGYMYESETDSVLHENYFCTVVDVELSCIVYRSQSDCSSEWNDKNQLVSDGEVLFKPLPLVKANTGTNGKTVNVVESVHAKAMQLYKQGKKKDAGLTAQSYLQKNPIQNVSANFEEYNNLAFFLIEATYYKESIPVLTKVIAAVPSRTVAYFNLADAYAGLGDTVNARKNYQIYIDQMKKSGKAAKIPARVLNAVK